ncbi:MAG: hypothetical protein QME66_13935 [Candidatus Eisenbacteria bacterium]|nr:hypothetical protein [Candidatus Eisenbacteria bacterium]
MWFVHLTVAVFLVLIGYAMTCFARIGVRIRANRQKVDFTRAYEIPFKLLWPEDSVVRQLLVKGALAAGLAFMALGSLLILFFAHRPQ